eukprot:1471029-Amphidinium_carterae.2
MTCITHRCCQPQDGITVTKVNAHQACPDKSLERKKGNAAADKLGVVLKTPYEGSTHKCVAAFGRVRFRPRG